MAFPLLPPLKKDGDGLAVLPRTGTWEQVFDVALKNIADNLQVTKIDGKFIDIDSIPSMWARPLLFEIALYDKAHPMHECVVGEWRGLLAMLALKEQRKFRLETKLITIPDGNDGKPPEFLQALNRLLPQRTLDDAGTTWDKLYLILFKDNPIGITSPTTLVCTSIDYIKHITVNDVHWYDPPFLCDPIPHLNDGEKTSVAGWLNDFHKNTITPLPDSPIKANLAPRILDFIKDLGGAPDGQAKLAGTPLGMAVGIFTGMDYPIAPKEYFTEKLYVINQQTAYIKENILSPKGSTNLRLNGDDVTPILPIRKEMLNEFSVDDLQKRISFVTTPNGIKVDLQYLSPGDGKNILISKEYVKQSDGDDKLFKNPEIVVIEQPPVLEVWPNINSSDWKTYFTYFTKAGQNTFDAEPIYEKDEALVSCYLEKDTEIAKTSAFPQAMICTYKDHQAIDSEEAGILLISPKDAPQGVTTWNIGIDFGTSGTTVYKQDPTINELEPISFENHLFQITNSRSRFKVYEQFFSSRLEETPFFSLFQQHPDSRKKSQSGERLEPMLDGRIYFVEDYKLKENVVSNLKWSPDPEDRIRTQTFIEQICLQCAAEALHNEVNLINWHFSYPLAFSQKDKAAFNTICTNATNACEEKTGIQNGNVNFESESITTAKYFAGKFGGFADGAVCIDIGGETSDISIWQDNTLCWQTSIRFAGRHIFLDLLKHMPEFLKNFDVPDADIKILKEVSNSDKFYSQADTWIDAWINDSIDGLKDKFAIYGGRIEGTPFIPLIALGISGLLYYVGLILNCLIENKDFKPTMPNVYIGGNGARILHWLANGDFTLNPENSKYLKKIILLASGCDRNAIFDLQITPEPKHEAAAGLIDDRTQLVITTEDYGILAGEDFEDFSWTTIITAENLGKSQNLEKNLEQSGDKLSQIENLIKIFNEGLGKELGQPINLDPEFKKNLNSDVNDWLQDLAIQPDDGRIVEPIFIKVMGKLLERKIKEWN